jgi:hypothetical protein
MVRVACGARRHLIEFAPFDTGDKHITLGSADVLQHSYAEIHVTVVEDSGFVFGEGIASGDKIHQIDIMFALWGCDVCVVKIKVTVDG